MRHRISHRQAAELGWTRVDPRPWRTKCDAKWKHRDGWRLEHCGHPTALHPWALYCPPGMFPDNPRGDMVCTGITGEHKRPDFGRAWDSVQLAFDYVATVAVTERRAQ